MDEKPNYYAIIPAEVRYNTNLRANEKLLFGEITALSNATGVCTASNNYFAKLYNVVPSAITRWVKDLEKYNYITVEYIKEGKEIKQRIIRITGIHKYDEVFTNVVGGYSQMLKENNTSINNKENNNINIITKERFKKPTLEDVQLYCKERNNNVDAKRFIDFYEANNWTDSKGNKVKSWKQKVITWESHQPTKHKEELPIWWNKTNKDFEEELTDEERREYEAIKNGTYKP